MEKKFKCNSEHARKGNVIAGIMLLAVGGILLLRQFGYIFPFWLFTWPVLLIVIGLFIGVKNNFRDFAWLVMVAIGTVFLLDDIFPEFPVRQYAWPVLIIGAGLILILAPKRSGRSRQDDSIAAAPENSFVGYDPPATPHEPMPAQAPIPQQGSSREEILEIVAIFGGIKKRILSKNFRGGEIVAVFGGSEVNLTQADFGHIIEIEIVQIFGGTKLIVPSHWEVRSECFVLLGGVDDKRLQPVGPAPEKILVLKGTTICGGIEIISYS